MNGIEVSLSVGMMLVTAITHTFGLWAMEVLGFHGRDINGPRRMIALLGVVLALLALHVIEILEYAALYVALGATPDFESAVYFSGAVYSTIGAVGVELPQEWRLIGSMEGVNGMVMIGWSTAYLFTAWRHVGRPRRRRPHH